jgi:hypothetical protein
MTIFSAITAAYGRLIVASNLIKANLIIYSTSRKKMPIEMDRTHQNFLSVLNTISWTTKLKGNHLNGIGCAMKLPATLSAAYVALSRSKGNNST